MKKAYSTNDEEFNYESAGEALQALADDGELFEGRGYYEIETEPVDMAARLRSRHVLEVAEEWLYDEIGEAAEDAYAVTKEAADEWDAFVAAWTAKHVSARCWRCVGNSKRLEVTAADVAEHAP